MRELPGFFINGVMAPPAGSGTRDLITPSTGEVFGRVPLATEADIDAAVRAAREAFDDGRWSNLSVQERADILNRAADLIDQRVDEIAAVAPAEIGQGVVTSRIIAEDSAGAIRRAVRIALDASWEEERPGSWDYLLRHEPVGVVGVISPWNGTPWLTACRAANALAAGCTVVDKPAIEAPFSTMIIIECLHEAGVPAGVINCVPGDRDAGAALVAHPGVDKIAFTGSSVAGAQIASICGQQLKAAPLLELGGKSAAIVLEDGDLGDLRGAVASGTFWNSGQVCVALSRVLAPRSRYDEVVDALVAEAESWTPGDPFDENVILTPLISEQQREKVERYIEAGVSEGATVAAGGTRPDREGYFVQPTVFRDVTPDMRIAREEIFGPVVAVIPYDTEEEALQIANDSEYGLHGAVFTADHDRALDVASKVRTGTFTINGFTMNFDAPLGGVKNSGNGRMGAIEGFDEFRVMKTVNLRPGAAEVNMNPVNS